MRVSGCVGKWLHLDSFLKMALIALYSQNVNGVEATVVEVGIAHVAKGDLLEVYATFQGVLNSKALVLVREVEDVTFKGTLLTGASADFTEDLDAVGDPMDLGFAISEEDSKVQGFF